MFTKLHKYLGLTTFVVNVFNPLGVQILATPKSFCC